ncbi:hypothetical protein HAX54_000886, partial [Datura stramonium]|nr:hypothetical protein [Datura stramonium]
EAYFSKISSHKRALDGNTSMPIHSIGENNHFSLSDNIPSSRTTKLTTGVGHPDRKILESRIELNLSSYDFLVFMRWNNKVNNFLVLIIYRLHQVLEIIINSSPPIKDDN